VRYLSRKCTWSKEKDKSKNELSLIQMRGKLFTATMEIVLLRSRNQCDNESHGYTIRVWCLKLWLYTTKKNETKMWQCRIDTVQFAKVYKYEIFLFSNFEITHTKIIYQYLFSLMPTVQVFKKNNKPFSNIGLGIWYQKKDNKYFILNCHLEKKEKTRLNLIVSHFTY